VQSGLGQINVLNDSVKKLKVTVMTAEEKEGLFELERSVDKTVGSLYRAVKLIDNSTNDCLVHLEKDSTKT
jgi:hypothetical protein